MSSEKKPGFWQRLFGLGPEEPPKKEPPAPKPAKKEPESKPAQKEPPERKKPKTEQLRGLTGAGALGGAFWGLLFGLLFFIPLLGMAIGAGMGALMGSMTDVGIHDDFIRKVRDEVTPGTSALFVMSGNVVADRVLAEFKDTGAHLASSNLSSEQEAKLREVFAEDEAQTPAG